MTWLAERFTDWLASPAALLQGLILTLVWLPAVFLGIDRHGFWFLFAATLVSFITQFPLAYASRRSEAHMLKLMKLLVALAEENKVLEQAAVKLDERQDELLDLIINEGRKRHELLMAISEEGRHREQLIEHLQTVVEGGMAIAKAVQSALQK